MLGGGHTGKARRRQMCRFRKRATSAPAEGPTCGLVFARHWELSPASSAGAEVACFSEVARLAPPGKVSRVENFGDPSAHGGNPPWKDAESLVSSPTKSPEVSFVNRSCGNLHLSFYASGHLRFRPMRINGGMPGRACRRRCTLLTCVRGASIS